MKLCSTMKLNLLISFVFLGLGCIFKWYFLPFSFAVAFIVCGLRLSIDYGFYVQYTGVLRRMLS
jgi:hypothetical protein